MILALAVADLFVNFKWLKMLILFSLALLTSTI